MEHIDLSFMALVVASAASALSLAAGPEALQVELMDKKGKAVGTVTLTELDHGVKIEVNARGLKPGKHGFHIHENPVCLSPDFKSAGDHLTLKGRKHGYDMMNGPHQGDLPNLVASSDGEVHAEVINADITLKDGPRSLFAKAGASFVLHEARDDYVSQPAGNSGDRVACAELRSINRQSASLR
jgi:Cu-Zn family superoxide dismutase